MRNGDGVGGGAEGVENLSGQMRSSENTVAFELTDKNHKLNKCPGEKIPFGVRI